MRSLLQNAVQASSPHSPSNSTPDEEEVNNEEEDSSDKENSLPKQAADDKSTSEAGSEELRKEITVPVEPTLPAPKKERPLFGHWTEVPSGISGFSTPPQNESDAGIEQLFVDKWSTKPCKNVPRCNR
jgi:hypothetical protein